MLVCAPRNVTTIPLGSGECICQKPRQEIKFKKIAWKRPSERTNERSNVHIQCSLGQMERRLKGVRAMFCVLSVFSVDELYQQTCTPSCSLAVVSFCRWLLFVREVEQNVLFRFAVCVHDTAVLCRAVSTALQCCCRAKRRIEPTANTQCVL